MYVNKKHEAVTTIRQLVPPIFVLYFFSLVFTPFMGWFGIFYCFPFVLYTILNVFASLSKAKAINDFMNLVKTYWILHFSYGLGYLNGIWDFLMFGKLPSDNQKRLSR